MCTRSLTNWTCFLQHRQRIPNQSLVHLWTCPASNLMPRPFHRSLQLSSRHTAVLLHSSRTVLRRGVSLRAAAPYRTFRTKPRDVSDSPKVRKKGKWREIFTDLLLGTAVVGVVYYFVQDEQDKRKIRVFWGGVRRFLR